MNNGEENVEGSCAQHIGLMKRNAAGERSVEMGVADENLR